MTESLTPELTSKLCRMISAKLPRAADKDDLLQEALMAAWKAPLGYEMMSARWQCIDYLRRTNRGTRYGRYSRQVDMPVIAAKVDIEGDLIRRESIERLHEVVAALPEIYRPYMMARMAGRRTEEMVRAVSKESGYGLLKGWRIYREALGCLCTGLATPLAIKVCK